MKQSLLVVATVAASMTAMAKLPAPDDAAKAKAAETKAKADWQAKVEAYNLCKVQDRVAARFKKSGKAAQVSTAGVKPAATAAAAPTGPTSAGAPPAAGAAAAGATAGAPPAPSTQPGGVPGTPVASAPLPPCVDPGPFAYAPPEQKPLETSGAHSPAPTAAGAPSVRPHSGEFPQQPQAGQQPAKK